MALTEKQKSFCREYFSNGGNATQAYLFAYNSNSDVSAAQEGYRLLQNDDIQEYLNSLNRPLEGKAISERQRKREILWESIEECRQNKDYNAMSRMMDILNKMDSEYININRNIDETPNQLDTLTIDQLKRITDG